MIVRTQPWIHSWLWDFVCLHSFPIIFTLLAFFQLPPFNESNNALLLQLVFAVLIIDWAHIFAQWHRIYSNPLEKSSTKKAYLLSYLLLIPLLTVVIHFGYRFHINVFLIYFVVFHFIKQSYGFIKIYSRIDGPKTPIENKVENLLIYLCMWTPVLYWHINFPKPDFSWAYFFIKNPLTKMLFWPAITAYIFCFCYYLYAETKRWKTKKIFNLPKNMALLSSAVGWGAVSLLPENKLLIMFTVVLTHDLSYTFFVWYIARRDQGIIKGSISWMSFSSIPGFFIFLMAIILISHPIMVLHLEMAQNKDLDYWLFGTFFNNAPSDNEWWKNFGWAIFFATQAHHYFIDRYLWKKEKDLSYMVATGAFKADKKVLK